MTVLPDDDDVGRTSPRRDVSSVPPQDGEVAKRCPLAVQYRTYPPAPPAATAAGDHPAGAPARPSDIDRLRDEERVAHVAAVHRALQDRHPDAVSPDARRDPSERVARTVAAMADGAPAVISGQLPTDPVGRRRGRPLVLVRAERRPDGRWAYHPVEVAGRRTLDAARARADPAAGAAVAALDAPWWDHVAPDPGRRARSNRGDLLRLAHSHRLLAHAGHGSSVAAGGVIGREEVVVWHRLDVPVAQHRWDLPERTDEPILARYDLEFSFRLDVLAAAALGTPIVGPVAVGECARCPWRPRCWPEIEAADSTSLLPGFGYRQWYNLARRSITTRAQVAGLDLRTAAVRDALTGGIGVRALADAARSTAPETPIGHLVRSLLAPLAGRRQDRAEREHDQEQGEDDGEELDRSVARTTTRLEQLGVTTVGDLSALDPEVLALAEQPIRSLGDAIQGARAQASGQPQLRLGVAELVVPGADVEIDIDMESALDGTAYLWGALVDGAYHAAVSWERTDAEVAAEVFLGFWDWLVGRRRAAEAEGQSIATYCWFRGAESGALRAGARAARDVLGVDRTEEVEAFLASGELVDLYEVFTRQLVTGASAGLKTVATSAGFAWRDVDPNGADSMAWHVAATSGEPAGAADRADQADRAARAKRTDPADAARDAARRRLLAYNEDDVRATAAVRHWMRTELAGVPLHRR